MKSSIFSDTDSVRKSTKIQELPQKHSSATKSEGSNLRGPHRFSTQPKSADKKENKSESSVSYLLKSFAKEDRDLYTPTKASSYCQEEYEEDSQSGIEEMKQLVKENKQVLKSFYWGQSSEHQESSCKAVDFCQPKVSNSASDQVQPASNQREQWIFRLCIFVMILLFFGALYKIGGTTKKEEAINTLGNGLSSCWENFKKENCDLNNPIGPFCKKLLECTLNKQGHSKEIYTRQHSSDSMIEEVCALGVLAGFVYLFGVQNTMNLFMAIFNLLKKLYELKREGKNESQQEEDGKMRNK